jgi:hypothetical protein
VIQREDSALTFTHMDCAYRVQRNEKRVQVIAI